jgi:hypothetical protein
MGNSWSKNRKKACVAVCLLSTVPATTAWEYSFGNSGCWDGAAPGPDCCIFSGDSAGALTRTGECPSEIGYLDLSGRVITSITDGVFTGMGKLQ